MRAVALRTPGVGPEVVSIPEPAPGPGQVLLRVTAAGLCQSDFMVFDLPERVARQRFTLPLTLGHEAVGTVAALGDGVNGVEVGDPVAVYGPWGCGLCRACAQGRENYCPRAGRLGIRPPGLGWPGALAEYLLVDSVRHLVPIGDLDPVQVVPLTDAGLTAYHAIERSLPKLTAGATVVVIGVGGLGHLGIQVLRALTPARVIALDVAESKLALAAEVGAHETLRSDDRAARAIRKLTGGSGAEVVLDFVGTPSTVTMAGLAVAGGGDVTIAGTGGGTLPVGFAGPAHGVSVASTYWGTRSNLFDIVELARTGAVRAHVETFPIEETPKAYDRLRAGEVDGRAVALPGP